jgi:serpin B
VSVNVLAWANRGFDKLMMRCQVGWKSIHYACDKPLFAVRNFWCPGVFWNGVGQFWSSRSDAALVSGNNAFAFELYARLSEKPGNLFFSPFSISMCLGMTYAGAHGETETQMRDVLHFSDEPYIIPSSFAKLQQKLDEEKRRDGIQLDIANALWAENGGQFFPGFMKIAKDQYQAEIKRSDFLGDADGARREINDWIASKTHDKIQDILRPGSLDAPTTLVLVNAIYFNAAWALRFLPTSDFPEPFSVSTDTRAKAMCMHKIDTTFYAADDNVQVLDMPYVGEEISMMILLPAKIDGLAQIEKQLSPDVVDGWVRQLAKTKVQITLPKFKMESRYSLTGTLAKMGMSDALKPGKADFSGMDGSRKLYISEAIHQSWVNVSEEGTEAAAATVVTMGRGASNNHAVEFRADHPFLFLIRDRISGVILFIGRVADPTLH